MESSYCVAVWNKLVSSCSKD